MEWYQRLDGPGAWGGEKEGWKSEEKWSGNFGRLIVYLQKRLAEGL